MRLKIKERLVEMAIINPKLSKRMKIQVEVEQRNEGPIPHVHVYHDHTRNLRKCSYVRIDTPKYSTHHGKDKIIYLDRKLKEEFIEIMESKVEGVAIMNSKGEFYNPTGYQFAVYTWSQTFEDGDLSRFKLDSNGEILNLDYSNL